MKSKLRYLISNIVSGEWGDEIEENDFGTNIIRAANFNIDGSIDYNNLEKRLIPINKIDTNQLLENDIIIEKSGGGPKTPVGRVAYFENPDGAIYLCNNFTSVLRIDSSKINPKYLFYKFQHLYQTNRILKYQNQTTGLFNLKIERYLEEEINVPEFDSQYRIATQLDQIRSLINYRLQSIKILEELIRSTFFTMFGDPVLNSKCYETISLSDPVFALTSGITPTRTKPDYFGGNIAWAKSTDVNGKIIFNTEECINEETIKNTGARVFPENSILIAMYGQGKTRGNVALLGIPASCNQACAVLKPNSIISHIFLFSLLRYSYKYLRSLGKGGNQDNLSLAVLKKINVINPPKNEQLKFESFFIETQIQRGKLLRSLEFLETLFKSVLQESFKENSEINEEPIFEDLIKKLNVDDLKGNVNRLRYLINLFTSKKFSDPKGFSEARDKLFKLIETGEIEQLYQHENIEFVINETH